MKGLHPTSHHMKGHWMVRAVDQLEGAVNHGAIDGATDGASDGSASKVANNTDCKLSYKVLI